MKKLTVMELQAIDMVIEGEPLGKRLPYFHSGMSKLRFGTRTNIATSLPELALGCDYSLKWIREHRSDPDMIRDIVNRYQDATYIADYHFWRARAGL